MCRKSDKSVKKDITQDSNDSSVIRRDDKNVNNKSSEFYSYAAFEKQNSSVGVINQKINERHNLAYELNGIQAEKGACTLYNQSKCLHADNHYNIDEFESGTYDTTNAQNYTKYNVSNKNTSVPIQNLYDTSVGIYNHLDNGTTKDHLDETYDHFHKSEQDYDQIKNSRLSENASSEYAHFP